MKNEKTLAALNGEDGELKMENCKTDALSDIPSSIFHSPSSFCFFAPLRLCVKSSAMVSKKNKRNLRRAYALMRARSGHQHWWPGETPFEVCVGAILTQNTAWTNVERAIANLKMARVLEPEKLFALPEAKLAELIRPAGYFNVKARRLRSFLRVLVGEFGGDLKQFFAGKTTVVREQLLAINGIGPETADSMLLYAGGHQSFVIDAYTKRIFSRHGWTKKSGKRKAESRKHHQASYDELKTLCESALNQNAGAARLDYWQDYHAQLVMVGKHFCRTRAPRCEDCPLKPLLPKLK